MLTFALFVLTVVKKKISTEVRLVQENITGYEGYLVVKADGCQVKKLMIALEETKIGRLYDIDVLEKENTKISRKDLGFPERKCLLCDNPACQCVVAIGRNGQ